MKISNARPRLRIRRKIAFASITVVLGLAGLEGLARLAFPAGSNARWRAHANLVDALGFPALNDVLQPDEQLFWTVRPGLDRVALAGRIAGSVPIRFSVSSDADGCRGAPAADVKREIACVGDSCTFGVGVNDDQTFPAILQSLIPGAACMNLGVPGYTAFQGRRRLEQFQFRRPPDIVVICFGFNDAAPWDGESDAEHARRIAARGGSLWRRSRIVQVLERFASPAATPDRADPGGRPRLTDDEYAEELREMIAWCRGHGAEPVLLLWPMRDQGASILPKQLTLRRVAESERAAIVDLLPAFVQHAADGLYVDGLHASAAGCRLVAEALRPVVAEILARRAGGTQPSRSP